MREQYKVRCPYNHYGVEAFETKEESHLQRFHGSFECALGACERDLTSRFQYAGIRRHLQTDHGISSSKFDDVWARFVGTKGTTIRVSHVAGETTEDCKICSKQQRDTALKQNNKEDIDVQVEERPYQY